MSRPHSRVILCLTSLFIISLLLTFNASADKGASGIERMVRQIEGLFPVLEGYVLSVKGDRVAIDLKRGQAVAPGQTLKLIRYGKTLTHPVTQKVIGREETDLGQVKVLEVRKDYSLARVLTPGVQAQKGHGVRSAFKKINILVAPVQASDGITGDPQALGLEIETRLNRRVRFSVPSFDLGVWLLENEVPLSSLTRLENLQRLRKKVAADFILLARVRSIKDQTVLRVRLVSTADGRLLKETQVLIPSLPVAQSPVKEQEVQTDFRPDKGPVQFIGKHEFDFEMVDFAVGDLTGNGENEFVMIDDHRVMIYKYANQQFRKIGQLKTRKNINRFLAVDVADINGNGRDEIFVTNHWGDRLKSFVLEVVPGKKGLTRIWNDVNLYFRVLRDFDGPPLLVSQRPDFERPFRPGIRKIHFNNGKYEVGGGELPLQSGNFRNLTLYGLAFGHISPAKSKQTIFLDNNYKLRVYSSGGRLLVSSNEYFGHDPRLIEVGVHDVVTGVSNHPEESQPVRFKGRPQLVRQSARRFLLLPKNHRTGGSFLESLVSISDASLVFFAVSEEGLSKVHETKKQTGYLAAFQVVDIDNSSGKQVHVATVSNRGGFFKGQTISTMYTYSW